MADSHPSVAQSQPPAMALPQSQLEQFLERNFKSIMLGFAALAVALAVFFIMRYMSAQKEQEAAEKFTAAMGVEDCDVVVQKYPGSAAAGNALLMKANFLWSQDRKDTSIATLQEFVRSYGSHKLHASGLLGLATKQAAVGDKSAARATLDELLKKYPKSELAPAADIQIADLFWAEGKTDEAKKQLDSLLQKYPGNMTAFNQAVDERVQLLNAGLPMKEVDGPPKPKPVPTPGPAPAGITPMKAPEIKMPAPGALPAPAPAAPAKPAATPTPAPPAPSPATATPPVKEPAAADKPAPAPAPATPAASSSPAPAPAPGTPKP